MNDLVKVLKLTISSSLFLFLLFVSLFSELLCNKLELQMQFAAFMSKFIPEYEHPF